jgi:hypothetical protein
MRLRNLTVLFLILFLSFSFWGCSSSQAPLVLTEIGPSKTKVGQGFNIQPDGGSAMWAGASNATKTTVIVWGEKQLDTTFQNPKLLTAGVPKDFYSKPGQNQIYLLDTKTGVKSNSLVLVVTE